jgi:hypothetical protein
MFGFSTGSPSRLTVSHNQPSTECCAGWVFFPVLACHTKEGAFPALSHLLVSERHLQGLTRESSPIDAYCASGSCICVEQFLEQRQRCEEIINSQVVAVMEKFGVCHEPHNKGVYWAVGHQPQLLRWRAPLADFESEIAVQRVNELSECSSPSTSVGSVGSSDERAEPVKWSKWRSNEMW